MKTPRTFHLSDAIVLIAATALGLAAVRPHLSWLLSSAWSPFIMDKSAYTKWFQAGWNYLLIPSPAAAAWTLAVLALRLRRPRARWRQLCRQPGFVAGLVTASVLVARAIGYATMRARVSRTGMVYVHHPTWLSGGAIGGGGGFPADSAFLGQDHLLTTIGMIGMSVLVSWFILALSGRWRADPSWVDRVGRALGVFWIATIPLAGWWDFHAWY